MAIVLLQLRADGHKKATRITDEPCFKAQFLPLCGTLGMNLLPRALQGLRVDSSDLMALRHELTCLQRWAAGPLLRKRDSFRKHVSWASQVALDVLNEAAADPAVELFLVSSYRPQEATGLKPFDHETLTPLGEPTDVAPALRPLYSLTSLSDWTTVVDRCKSFGWRVAEEEPDAGYARFLIGEHLGIYADTGAGGGRPFAYGVLYWFHQLGPEMAEFYPSPGRSDYDRAYKRSRLTIEALLGAPAAQGEYRYDFRPDWPYRYAVWTGDAGVLILRQDELDIQMGMDINVWVQPWNPSDPVPSPPIGF
jgi:hypothetical protein